MWKITIHKSLKFNNAILIEGLPGIGNVGKVVVDYLVEQFNADLYRRFFSYDLPNTVFVNQDNLVQLPVIELYHKKINGQDFLFLAGEVQPRTERSSYEFTDVILSICKEHNVKEIITLGGIGLTEPKEKPLIYTTGNDKDLINKLAEHNVNKDIYGVVGPILGLTGLLLGMADRYGVSAATLLVETYNNPMYLGLKEAKELMLVLNKLYDLNVSFDDLEKEINNDVDDESSISKNAKRVRETNYIG